MRCRRLPNVMAQFDACTYTFWVTVIYGPFIPAAGRVAAAAGISAHCDDQLCESRTALESCVINRRNTGRKNLHRYFGICAIELRYILFHNL